MPSFTHYPIPYLLGLILALFIVAKVLVPEVM